MRFTRAIAVTMIVTTSVRAQAPDLSGTWRLDPTRSASVGGGRGAGRGTGGGNGTGGGLGLGPSPDSLIIKQDAQSLQIDEFRGAAQTHVVYALDGKKTANSIGSGRGVRSAVYTTSLKNGQFVTTITAPAAPESKETVKYQEQRYLGRDGSLVVQTGMIGKPNSRTVAYLKAPKISE